MRRLLILVVLTAYSTAAQSFEPRSGRQASGYAEPAYNATMNFDVSLTSAFKITLTGNVTASSANGVGTAGGGGLL